MLPIHVLVVASMPDVMAEVIAAAVVRRADMVLVAGRFVAVEEVDDVLQAVAPALPCALVVIGCRGDMDALPQQLLVERRTLVVLHLDIVDDIVHVALGDIGLDALLGALKDLASRVTSAPQDRVLRLQMRQVCAGGIAGSIVGNSAGNSADAPDRTERPLLDAAIDWIHAVLRQAMEQIATGNGDLPGLTLTAATVAGLLDAGPTDSGGAADTVRQADARLAHALALAPDDPIALAVRLLDLTGTELRVLLLALAPELDARYQRCFGVLLDDLGRRVPTLGLCAALLGAPKQVRCDLAAAGNLARWRLLECRAGALPPADEPLRPDVPVALWLLGQDEALALDPPLRRALADTPWPGAALLDRQQERIDAVRLMERLLDRETMPWLLLGGADGASWRALCELGAQQVGARLLRIVPARLVGADHADIEECALRLARLARLCGRPLVIDADALDATPQASDSLRTLCTGLSGALCRAAIVCPDATRIVGLLGAAPFEVEPLALAADGRTGAARAAAHGASVVLTEEGAHAVARHYPLQVDGFERAMRLAASRPPAQDSAQDTAEARYTQFAAACKEVAAANLSGLAERIAPVFDLDNVVLPADRKQQLGEIVANIRLGARVLDDWNFRAHLPYGRGVTALFHGPSGTGKTMAALAVARSLGIEILRFDFSRVVSKYIGDTEKNIDRVFDDATRSGCAILIDEADALLGKRSEVKDAHDRYANIEVAYLLQRMEAYDGLAILTTNLRQNLDAAFLRRLRFIIDFPRPDADAREQIWRDCLPAGTHQLDAAAFRLLARKVELTGGHIRQITLRAAFVAAAADATIGFDHILYATNAEFAKLGMPALERDVRDARRAA